MSDVASSNPDADPYVAGLAAGLLLMQTCDSCHHVQFPPRVRCVACGGGGVSYVEVDGGGVVYAKTINRRAPEPAFEHLLPYAVALVDLTVGVRVMARAAVSPEQVVTGGRVKVFADPDPVVGPGLLFAPDGIDEGQTA